MRTQLHRRNTAAALYTNIVRTRDYVLFLNPRSGRENIFKKIENLVSMTSGSTRCAGWISKFPRRADPPRRDAHRRQASEYEPFVTFVSESDVTTTPTNRPAKTYDRVSSLYTLFTRVCLFSRDGPLSVEYYFAWCNARAHFPNRKTRRETDRVRPP